MINLVKVEIKSFSDLTPAEAKKLAKIGKKQGAFRELMQSMMNGKINNPKNILLAIGKLGEKICGWVMLDKSGEYNDEEDNAAIMAYVRSEYRKKKIAALLVESLSDEIKKCEAVTAYVYPEGVERKFFLKMSEKIEKPIKFNFPRCYFAKY